METSVSENKFNEILKSDFNIKWNFDNLESWFQNANFTDDVKTFVEIKTEQLRGEKGTTMPFETKK